MSAIGEILTVGHSTHQVDVFIALLEAQDVRALADVRRHPGSRRMPHWNAPQLAAALARAGIEYLHLPELGGRRRPLPGSPNGGWRVDAFRGYADHLASEEFAAGLERLIELAAHRRTAMMCAEAAWWRCHRRLLADVLVARDWTVLNLGPRGDLERHELTAFAVVEDGLPTYPPAQAALEVD